MGMDWESLSEATSGAAGALVSTTVLYPLDTCKTKYQAEVRSLDADGHGRPPKYRSGFTARYAKQATGRAYCRKPYRYLGETTVHNF